MDEHPLAELGAGLHQVEVVAEGQRPHRHEVVRDRREVDRASELGRLGGDLGRDLEPDAVRAAIDRAPLIGDEAVETGLVDGLMYRDEALDALRERAGDGDLLFGVGDLPS